MSAFHTDAKIAQILDEAAECGVTALACPPDERWRKLWAKYTAGGGKLKIWISQCHGPADQMPAEIDRSIGAGAKAIFIQGHKVEDQFEKGTFDVVGDVDRPHPQARRARRHRRAPPGRAPGGAEAGLPERLLLPVHVQRRAKRGFLKGTTRRKAAEVIRERAREARHRLQDPRRRTASRRRRASSSPSRPSARRTASASAYTPRTPSTRFARTRLIRRC